MNQIISLANNQEGDPFQKIFLLTCNFDLQDEYNGNSMIAMAGKNCVAIATDTRLATQLMTVDTTFQRVFKVNDRTLMGISGLATDCQTL